MASWLTCDMCDSDAYTADNPFTEGRTPRPSDPSDLCCVIAGHLKCIGGKTPAEWQA